MNGLENGTLLPSQELSILNDLEWRLEAEIRWQNHLNLTAQFVEDDMREVKAAATSMKELMEKLKQSTLAAHQQFDEQLHRGIENAEKIKSAATDMREANQMMEGVLGETGSNFPPTEASASSTQAGHDNDHLSKADVNGVSLNKGQT